MPKISFVCGVMLGVLLVLLSFPFVVFGDLSETLREAGSKRDLFIGTAANYGYMQNDNDYKTTLEKQYNLITAENACKWSATEPSENQFDFTQCDFLYNYSVTYNQTFRGHNLCWGDWNPNWLTNGNFNAEQKQSLLNNHITTVINHYVDFEGDTNSPPVYCWDVVNEAVNDNPTNNSFYKTNVWYPDIPNYVDLAFTWAKEATQEKANGESVKLFYNDYNILMSASWMKTKSDAVYGMIKNMIKNGIPIDGIGMQGHTSVDQYPADYNGMMENFARYNDLGIEVHLTEIDIGCDCNGDFTSDISTKQAEMYATMLKACLDSPNCKNFESWGYTDKYTWLGSSNYPLPFDINLNPKDAAYYILNTLLNQSNVHISPK